MEKVNINTIEKEHVENIIPGENVYIPFKVRSVTQEENRFSTRLEFLHKPWVIAHYDGNGSILIKSDEDHEIQVLVDSVEFEIEDGKD